MTTINTLNKTEARAACKKAGISYTNMTVADMRAALEAHAQAATPVEPEAVVTTVEPAAEVVSEQRTDDAPAAPAAPAEVAAPAAAEPVKPKEPKKPADQRNGVTRPAAGNKCAQVWQALDALKAAGTEITFATLRPTVNADIADATCRTQWSRWRKHHGIAKEVSAA